MTLPRTLTIPITGTSLGSLALSMVLLSVAGVASADVLILVPAIVTFVLRYRWIRGRAGG